MAKMSVILKLNSYICHYSEKGSLVTLWLVCLTTVLVLLDTFTPHCAVIHWKQCLDLDGMFSYKTYNNVLNSK